MFRNCSAQILSVQSVRLLLGAFVCLTFLLAPAMAQQSAAVPNLVKFSGSIPTASGSSVSVVFALYANQSGGAPLWQEVQSLTVDSNGRYTALLGASTAGGVPVDLFSTNEARWLGVAMQGVGEQPRVLLVSVPYALKAADSETLGGLPASAYALAGSVNNTSTASSAASTTTNAYVNTDSVNSAARQAVAAAISITTAATAGTLPVFSDGSGDLGNSLVSQVSLATGGAGNFVGINTTAPVADLHILGVNPTMRIEQYGPVGSGDSPNFNFYTGNGTAAAPLATQDQDNLGQFAATGFNGSAFGGSKVKVTFVAVKNWTTGANGTAISFQTTSSTDTSVKRTERMRIGDNGNVGIGDFSTTPPPANPLTVSGIIQSTSGGFMFPDGSTLDSTNPLTAESIETTDGTAGTGSVTTNTVETETLNATGAVNAETVMTTGGTGGAGTVTTNTVAAATVNTTTLNLTGTLSLPSLTTTNGVAGTGAVTTHTLNAETLNATGAVDAATVMTTGGTSGEGTVTTNTVDTETVDTESLNAAGAVDAATVMTTGGTSGAGTVTTNTVDAATVNTTTLNLAGTLSVPSLETTGGTEGTGSVTTQSVDAEDALLSGTLVAEIVASTSSVEVDADGANNGTSIVPGLLFGKQVPVQVGISSNQSATGNNPGGLDFNTGNVTQMQIQANGNVGIGIAEGDTAESLFEADRDSSSTSEYPVAIFGDNPPLSNEAANHLASAAAAHLNVGVWGDGGTGDDGVGGSPATLGVGVVGTGDFGGGKFWTDGIGSALQAQYEGTSMTANVFLALGPTAGGGECDIDAGGNVQCTGTISGSVGAEDAVATGSEAARRVTVYAVESPENWLEDFGSATLSNGVATVALDAMFAQTVNTGVEYHVFLTPNGESDGLYVAQKSATSFEVREAHGGRSSISFDYRIVAKRAGYENLRMPDVTEKFMKLRKLGTTLTAQALPPAILAKMHPNRTKRVMRIPPAMPLRRTVAAPKVSTVPNGMHK